MDTFAAFARGRAARLAGARHRVFDWNKAAQIIKDRKPAVAEAGLGGDWEYTGGEIYRHRNIVPKDETYTYLSSNWAVPELMLDGETIPCWIYEDESPGWDCDTYWPESALAILNA